jgi:hypothetical protein
VSDKGVRARLAQSWAIVLESRGVDKYLEQHQRVVQRCFGWAAQIGGELGTSGGSGAITIMIGDRQLGAGPTFSEALQAAQQRAATLNTESHVRPRTTGA